MSAALPFLAALTALAFAALVSFVLCAWTKSLGILDEPDGIRKVHRGAISRLGGLGMLLAFLILTLLFAGLTLLVPEGASRALLLPVPASLLWPALGFAGLAALIGLWDDVKGMSAGLKLLILTGACLGFSGLGLSVLEITTPWGNLTYLPLLIAGSALWLLVFTNAANFMDGSNGLALGSLALMLAGLAAAVMMTGSGDTFSMVWFAMIGVVLGFLVHNLRGQLFAGDAGSFGIGGLFAALGLVSGLPVWTIATLALPFLIDVLLTLIWRARHGQSWMQAHRVHMYQRLIDSGWSHLEAAVLWWCLTAACAVSAVIAAMAGPDAAFAVFVLLTLTGCALWYFGKQRASGQ